LVQWFRDGNDLVVEGIAVASFAAAIQQLQAAGFGLSIPVLGRATMRSSDDSQELVGKK